MPPNSVTVRVPATSANLGPGFDALGIALDLAADIRLSLNEADGDRRDPLERMVLAGARSAYAAAGTPEPASLYVRTEKSIPIGRGLGASAVARVAGVVGANALMGGPLDADTMLRLASELEGHADNAAPALLGGLQVVVFDESGLSHVVVPVPKELRVILFVPDFSMPTKESRQRLPSRLTRQDAVFNIGRAALLIAAVATGRFDALRVATQDVLHQPARSAIFPAMPKLIATALDAGACAAYLSGAGSTIAAWSTDRESEIARALEETASANGVSGHIIQTRPSTEGARIVAEG